MKDRTLRDFLSDYPSFIEDLIFAADNLPKRKCNILRCALKDRAEELKQYSLYYQKEWVNPLTK